MTWEPLSPDEPAFVPLTDRMMRVVRDASDSGQTPEEILLARERLAEDERETRRKLSREMTRALVWMGTDGPERVQRLITWALPVEEAYILKRYLLHRDCRAEIARDVGITEQGVGYRLHRALWRLRVTHDLAWDMPAELLEKALSPLLSAADMEFVLTFWACRFSQSRTSEKLGRPQCTVSRTVRRITAHIGRQKARKDLREIHDTLTQVCARKLWDITPPQPWKGERWSDRRLRMPDGRESA